MAPHWPWPCGFHLHWLLIILSPTSEAFGYAPMLVLSCFFLMAQLIYQNCSSTTLPQKVFMTENQVKFPLRNHTSITSLKLLTTIRKFIPILCHYSTAFLTWLYKLFEGRLCLPHQWIPSADHRTWHILGIEQILVKWIRTATIIMK